ncbi:MAG: hypothetical protein M1817_003234 [Caeruleum heppii]|nr:MAG: hypothetical protein M1817_003234 [Caeruleum heppii]
MSFASSTFTIPRKPVGSILDCRVSEEKGRQSIDFWSSPSTAQSEWVAQPLLPRPRDSMAGSVYEKPLPVLPLRVRSYTTPVRTLYRRSSEMSLRTRGEDESLYLDGRIREIDTIEEEKAKSPVELGLDYDARATVPFRSVRPALAMVQPGPLNIRKRSLSRVSKWLFSFGTDRAPSPPEQMSPPPPTTFYQCPAAGPVQSSSTIATLTSATTLEGPPSLATVAAGSGESTPASALVGGRATLIRQHTFGLGHGKAPRKSEDVVRVFQSGPEYREVDSTSIGLPLASPVGMAF